MLVNRDIEAASLGVAWGATGFPSAQPFRFLQTIRPRIRAVVIPYLEGRVVREIAEMLGLKTKTVYSRLRQVWARLRTFAPA